MDFVVAGDDFGDGFGVGDVFLLEDAMGEGGLIVGVEDRDGALGDDDAVVELLVDEVDGAAGDLDAVVEGLLLGIEAGEGREQRGMDVEDALREGLDEAGREQAHVSGEAYVVDVVGAEGGDDFFVVLGALAAVGLDGEGFKAALACGFEAGRVGFVGDDDGDFAASELAGGDVVCYGEEVGATAGEQDAETSHMFILKWAGNKGERVCNSSWRRRVTRESAGKERGQENEEEDFAFGVGSGFAADAGRMRAAAGVLWRSATAGVSAGAAGRLPESGA